jgi:hypothetical protein
VRDRHASQKKKLASPETALPPILEAMKRELTEASDDEVLEAMVPSYRLM